MKCRHPTVDSTLYNPLRGIHFGILWDSKEKKNWIDFYVAIFFSNCFYAKNVFFLHCNISYLWTPNRKFSLTMHIFVALAMLSRKVINLMNMVSFVRSPCTISSIKFPNSFENKSFLVVFCDISFSILTLFSSVPSCYYFLHEPPCLLLPIRLIIIIICFLWIAKKKGGKKKKRKKVNKFWYSCNAWKERILAHFSLYFLFSKLSFFCSAATIHFFSYQKDCFWRRIEIKMRRTIFHFCSACRSKTSLLGVFLPWGWFLDCCQRWKRYLGIEYLHLYWFWKSEWVFAYFGCNFVLHL